VGEPTATAHALINESSAFLQTGQADDALQRAKVAYDIAVALEEPYLLGAALRALGSAEQANGDDERGVAHVLEGIALRRRSRQVMMLTDDLAALAEMYERIGRIEDAVQVAAEVSARIGETLDGQYRKTYLCAVLSKIAFENDDVNGARFWKLRGRAAMETLLKTIDDEPTAVAYRALPYNRALLVAD